MTTVNVKKQWNDLLKLVMSSAYEQFTIPESSKTFALELRPLQINTEVIIYNGYSVRMDCKIVLIHVSTVVIAIKKVYKLVYKHYYNYIAELKKKSGMYDDRVRFVHQQQYKNTGLIEEIYVGVLRFPFKDH